MVGHKWSSMVAKGERSQWRIGRLMRIGDHREWVGKRRRQGDRDILRYR